jgi:hypothetical protein
LKLKEQVQLLKLMFDFLDRLSEEQLQLLLTKKAKIKLEIEKEIMDDPTTHICLEEVCSKIESYTTREEVVEYINGLSLLKVDLKAIAKKYNIPLGSKETNQQIVEKIVENVVGSKLRFDALLNTDLK